jgi:hypothetical protein
MIKPTQVMGAQVFDRVRIPLMVFAAAALPGCAGTPGDSTVLLAPGNYTLTAEEKKLDCQRLTGRIQVRLLALRGEEFKVHPSSASQSMRSATSAALGSDSEKNATARAATNRPILDAYNNRLVELGCPSFDIAKELQARPSAPTPYPTIPASSKRAS